MANILSLKDRRVVPNWRDFGTTIVLGELNSFQSGRTYVLPDYNIDEYAIDWRLNNDVIHATDLLSAAVVNDKKDDSNVMEAAQFVLDNIDKATFSQRNLAKSIIDKHETDVLTGFSEVNLDNISGLIEEKSIINKIKGLKDNLNRYHTNPILFVELSRYYSILGQEQKAIMAMKIALHLAPDNRFILRSATRLFLHYRTNNNNYAEFIHNILRNNSITHYDPWLTSAEISIATVRDRNSKFIKRGIELIHSNNVSPFSFTELASGIGTIELSTGSTKKSRDLFNKALISPNDNSLAQIEWATTTERQLNVDTKGIRVDMDFEACALDNYRNEQFDNALVSALRWFADMPFSKRPILFASNLASTVMKNQPVAIAFLKEGLKSHPFDPALINNLAYALSLENKPMEALAELSKIKGSMVLDDSTRICLTATKGIANFRNGNIEEGRYFYLLAIEETIRHNFPALNRIATLNYVREELLANTNEVDSAISILNKMPDNPSDIDTQALKKDIEALLDSRKPK